MKGQGCFLQWTQLKGAATAALWAPGPQEGGEKEVIKQRSHYACTCNERSICHISHKIISSAALSKYLTGANKWKIIAKCPGTPNFIHLFFYLRAFRCFNGSWEEAINLPQLSRSFISVCVVATLQLINSLFGTLGCCDMREEMRLFPELVWAPAGHQLNKSHSSAVEETPGKDNSDF